MRGADRAGGVHGVGRLRDSVSLDGLFKSPSRRAGSGTRGLRLRPGYDEPKIIRRGPSRRRSRRCKDSRPKPGTSNRDEARCHEKRPHPHVSRPCRYPNIVSIYGLEQSDSTHYLVLELVPGETLAERIARGPIPLEEDLDIATQMAEALDDMTHDYAAEPDTVHDILNDIDKRW